MIDIAFLNHLSTARSDTEFLRTATGFAALKVYESVKTHRFGPVDHEEAFERVARDIARVETETGIGAALDALIQALPFWEAAGPVRVGRRAVYTALISYGQALGAEGEWQIAERVYALVGMDAELDGETLLAAEARHLMGRAARMYADWETSQTAYRRAYELAMEAGNLSLALRAQIGEANNLWIRGDIPGAKRRLDTIARRARESCPAVLPRVTLARAGVANVAGEYERAIHIAFGLLDTLSDNDEVKYQTLVDLAAFLSDYGLPGVAATALRVVERAAPELQVRRHARLNLFFLAARYGDEAKFGELRESLATERLTPRQNTQYALFAAQGYRRFSNFDAATASAERAASLANQFQLFQLAFEAEDEIGMITAARAAAVEGHAASLAAGDDACDDAWGPLHTTHTDYRAGNAERLPARIRRVAESLESMESQVSSREFEASTVR